MSQHHCGGIESEEGYLIGCWPHEITVGRHVVEVTDKHIQVGRRGVLNFTFKNGSAQYIRTMELPHGWVYRCIYSDGVPMKDEKAFDVIS